ncbi:S24/S26 family peptidase [Desulfosporosinus sp. OT]|uniref:S24/S26 family peptidase n=1 Tax=Desulfosporosinus sp. OT TaxID=913865 RepID=UPI000223A79D|nr:S24/S26 family peptidase [Desulfosporosinus sp. OT]EGW38455.1 peptidase S24-like family protein [Desulfosporosinus sp. OT]
MSEIKKIKAASIFPLISEILEHGQNTRLTVSGDSMYPFLRDGIDSVELTKESYALLSRGDIVLIQRTDGCYVMHRIVRKNDDCFFMVGDAQQWIEGPLYPRQLVAVVTAIWRKDKRIICSNIWWRILSEIWLVSLPFRILIFKIFRKIHKLSRIG